MTERLSSTDVAFLHRESRTTPQHVGGLAVFEPPESGFDYDRLVRLLEERISLAPRYRQKIRRVPGHLANPIWVDDGSFDITYHVRRSALPRPGTETQLLDFCSRIQSRMLDRGRPLWEMYLVEGLAGGRIAIVTKTHQSMVDEFGAVDLFEVILDAAPEPRRTVQPVWMPQPEPSAFSLLHEAALNAVVRPQTIMDTAWAGIADIRSDLVRATARAGGLRPAVRGLASVSRSVLRKPSSSPFQVELSEQRRIGVARTQLDDFRRVRAAYGGTVNDVVLAVVSGALRNWMLSRAVPLRPASTVRALVPVSVVDEGDRSTRSSSQAAHPARGGDPYRRIRPLLVDLPVGEVDPVLRLTQLRYAMGSHTASGMAVGASALTRLSGFAPPTMLALGARTSNGLTRRMFSLVVTNVPGPQLSLYAAGARLVEMFPIMPVSAGQAMAIGLSSYDGAVSFGINADRDGVADVADLAQLIEDALQELIATIVPDAEPSRPVAPVKGSRGSRATTPVSRGRSRTSSLTPAPRRKGATRPPEPPP